MKLIIEMGPYDEHELVAFAQWLQPSPHRKIRWSWQLGALHPRLVSAPMPETTAKERFEAMRRKAAGTYGSVEIQSYAQRFHVEDFVVHIT